LGPAPDDHIIDSFEIDDASVLVEDALNKKKNRADHLPKGSWILAIRPETTFNSESWLSKSSKYGLRVLRRRRPHRLP